MKRADPLKTGGISKSVARHAPDRDPLCELICILIRDSVFGPRSPDAQFYLGDLLYSYNGKKMLPLLA